MACQHIFITAILNEPNMCKLIFDLNMLLNETSKGSEPLDKVSTGLHRGVWKFCPVALN